MVAWPSTPVPSMVSAPEVIRPVWSYAVDQGYELRRPKHSRPRRRWTLEYLGKTTYDMRLIRHFVNYAQGGAQDFEWIHPTAVDIASITVGVTPVQLHWLHGLYDGQWVYTASSPNAGINDRAWQVTVLSANAVSLRGSTASGPAGAAMVWTYVPHLVVRLQQDTFPSPATLIGPEQIDLPNYGLRGGYFNYTVTLEEIF